jgi:hypothetical protein
LIRSQYSKICSGILQIRIGAEDKTNEHYSNRAATLSTALEEWYRSTTIRHMLSSLDHSDAMRIKLQISYHHYEARFHLLSPGLSDPQTSPPTGSEECRKLLNQATRDIITCSSTIPSEYLLQDQYVFYETESIMIHMY